jgi:cell division protein FtsB
LIHSCLQYKEKEKVSAIQLANLQAASQEKLLSKLELDKEKSELISSMRKEHTDHVAALNEAHSTTLKEVRARLEAKESQMAKLHKTVSTLGSEVETLNDTIAALKSVSAEQANQVEELTMERTALLHSINQSHQLQDKLNEAIRSRDAQIVSLQEQLARALAAHADITNNRNDPPVSDSGLPQSTVQPVDSFALGSTRVSSTKGPGNDDKDDAALTRDIPRDAIGAANGRLNGVDFNDSAGLSSEWARLTDELGNTYYFNSVTGVSSWSLPSGKEATQGLLFAPDSPNLDGQRLGDWVQVLDDTGRGYWYNEVTSESSWELPAVASFSGKKFLETCSGSAKESNSNGLVEYSIDL